MLFALVANLISMVGNLIMIWKFKQFIKKWSHPNASPSHPH
jgi:hypothetical protein